MAPEIFSSLPFSGPLVDVQYDLAEEGFTYGTYLLVLLGREGWTLLGGQVVVRELIVEVVRGDGGGRVGGGDSWRGGGRMVVGGGVGGGWLLLGMVVWPVCGSVVIFRFVARLSSHSDVVCWYVRVSAVVCCDSR